MSYLELCALAVIVTLVVGFVTLVVSASEKR